MINKKGEIGELGKYIIIITIMTCALLLSTTMIVKLATKYNLNISTSKYNAEEVQSGIDNLTIFQNQLQNKTSTPTLIPGITDMFDPTPIFSIIKDAPKLITIFSNMAILGLSGGNEQIAIVISVIFALIPIIVIVATLGYIISRIPL